MFVKYTSGHKPKARPKYESRLASMLCLWSALQDSSLRQRPKNKSRFTGEYPVLVKGSLWSTGGMYTCKYILTLFWLFVVCFVMGKVLQIRETAHRRIHYCCYHDDDIHPRKWVNSGDWCKQFEMNEFVLVQKSYPFAISFPQDQLHTEFNHISNCLFWLTRTNFGRNTE